MLLNRTELQTEKKQVLRRSTEPLQNFKKHRSRKKKDMEKVENVH